MPDPDALGTPSDDAPDDRKADRWAEADRAWVDPPDRWAEADRAWKTRDYAPPPSSDASERPRPEPSRGLGRSYTDGMSAAGPYLGLGAQIAASMLGFVGLGVLVDRWAGTSPWGVIGGAVFGLLGVMALVVRLSVEASARDKKRRGGPV